MFIVTLEDQPEGVFSVWSDSNPKERIVPLFQVEDDAERYCYQLDNDPDYPPMQVLEIEDHVIIGACQERGQLFTIVSPDDLLVPPIDNATNK